MSKLFLVSLLIGLTLQTPTEFTASNYSCAVNQREDCAVKIKINKEICEERGCCWNEQTEKNGDPWCFKPVQPTTGKCAVELEDKVECGYYGIMEKECIATPKCCWYPLDENSEKPWCYFSNNDNKCAVNYSNKIPCFSTADDVTEEVCEKEGCCWQPIEGHDYPKCYKNVDFMKSCEVDETQKKDCGYRGISEDDCEKRGCCFARSEVNGVPWCFYPQAINIAKEETTSAVSSSVPSEASPSASNEEEPKVVQNQIPVIDDEEEENGSSSSEEIRTISKNEKSEINISG